MGWFKKLTKRLKKVGRNFDEHVTQKAIAPGKKRAKKLFKRAERAGITLTPSYDTQDGASAGVGYSYSSRK